MEYAKLCMSMRWATLAIRHYASVGNPHDHPGLRSARIRRHVPADEQVAHPGAFSVRQARSSGWVAVPEAARLVTGTLGQLHGELDGLGCRRQAVDLVFVARLDVAAPDTGIGEIGYVVPGQAEDKAGVLGIDVRERAVHRSFSRCSASARSLTPAQAAPAR